MKVHVVREAFSLDGQDYPRGTALTDPAIIARALESNPTHVHATGEDIPEPTAEKPKGKGAEPSAS